MERYNRKAIFSELTPFDHLANTNDFIEVTEWYNGEGFDVVIDSKTQSQFHLTWGQFKALKKLLKKLEQIEEI